MSQFKSVDTHGAGPPIQVPADSKPTQGPYHWHPRVEADDRNGSVYLEKTPGHAYAVAMQPRYVENEAWAETAAFITDAFNTLHETGLTPQQLREQRDELVAVLRTAECLNRLRSDKAFYAMVVATISKVEGRS